MSLRDTKTELPTIIPLGTSYSSLTNVQAQCDSGLIQLLSAPVSVAQLSLWTTVASVMLAVFAFASWPKAAMQVGPLAVPIFVAITVLTLFGPIVMVLIHNLRCSQFNPLLEIDLNEGVVRVRNREKVFPIEKVHSLIAATVSDSEGGRLSELQLMVHYGDSLVPELVCTKYNSSSRRSFGKALSAVSSKLPFPALVLDRKGFFARGPLAITTV